MAILHLDWMPSHSCFSADRKAARGEPIRGIRAGSIDQELERSQKKSGIVQLSFETITAFRKPTIR